MFARKLGWSFLLLAVLLIATAATSWAGQCSQETVKGTWVDFEQGTILVQLPTLPPPPYLFTLVGRVTFDGVGNLSGTYVHSVAGHPVSSQTVAGTYTVTAECAYSDIFATSTGLTLHHTGFLTGEGMFQEAHLIYSDPGWMVSGTAKRQSMRDSAKAED